ncbi:MAG: NAD-dependent deacylase [Planctomycetes bacterium]|nr:NAD-dependent deacylase [Planctomycetota bacterium]
MATLAPDDAQRIEQVAELMRGCRSILFITGAGLSADSGLPTYRGVSGLYEGRDPEENLPIEVLLSGEALASRPDLTWKYLLQIEQACRGAKPNRGHEVIAEIESHFDRVWVLTQNVDGFHHRAGSANVIDIHGDLHQIRCMGCRFEQHVVDYTGFSIPPRCPTCGGLLRPAVVLFGELLPMRQIAIYKEEMKRGFDLVFSIGTTSVFPYIANPVLDAHHLRKPSVEINPSETDVTEFVTVKLRLKAAETLDAIWKAFTKQPAATS